MAVETPTVESSPTQILKDLTPAQHKTWRQTGDLPEVKTPEVPPKESKEATPAAPSPAAKEPAAPAPAKVAVETPAEPAPATPEPKAKGAEARIKELLSQNKELKSKLETLQATSVVPPTKTEKAPVKPSRNDVDEKSGQPKYATDDEFLEARDKYVAELASHQTRQDIAKETRERQVAEQNRITQQRMVNAVKIATERHPDFSEVLKIETKETDGKKVTTFNSPAMKAIKTNGIIDAWCLDSDLGMEVLYHLAKAGVEEVERIQAMTPFAAAKELTRLEDKLSVPLSTQKPAESSPARTTIKVPPEPAASVGGRGTPPVDDEAAAVEAGDFKRFAKTANEADWRKKKAS